MNEIPVDPRSSEVRSIQDRLDACRLMVVDLRPDAFRSAMATLRQHGLNEEETLLADVLCVHPLLGDFDKPAEALQRATTLLTQAQARGSALAQAWAWSTLGQVQQHMMLFHPALRSAAMAAEWFEQCGRPHDAATERAGRCGVMLRAEMFIEGIQTGLMLLEDRSKLKPALEARVLNFVAGGYYFLACSASEQHAPSLWRRCLEKHEESLRISTAHGLGSAMISHLNLAVVHATLGHHEACAPHVHALNQAPASFHDALPIWRDWRQLCEVLLQCHGLDQAQGWDALLALTKTLATKGNPLRQVLEAALHAVVRLGRANGQLEAALQASQQLLSLQRETARQLTHNLSESIDDVMERPRLEQRNEALSQQGAALQSSLAQRNAELSSALVALRAEAATRRQAELELQKANETLEQQVRQRSAELEQAMRVVLQQEKQLGLSRIVVGMAHEMNTPLGNARMAATVMQERSTQLLQGLKHKQLRHSDLQSGLETLNQGAALVDQELDRTADLVNRFKALAISQHQELPVDFDAAALLRDQHRFWITQIDNPGHRLLLEVPAQLPMRGYATALKAVLQQLLDNSLKHGLAGRSEGLIRVALSTKPGELILDWQDDGPGIAQAHLPHVLEPFFTTQMGQSGSGLGLTTVQSLVCDLMGGRLELRQPEAGGCWVQVRLPLAPA